jgi:hypothetical protein
MPATRKQMRAAGMELRLLSRLNKSQPHRLWRPGRRVVRPARPRQRPMLVAGGAAAPTAALDCGRQ